MREERVVLVDEHNEVLGEAPKGEVHDAHTPLHRGFSLFLFDSRGRVLAQQRSAAKRTWPLVWSNSCCGHPALGEPVAEAARRRLRDELGLELGRGPDDLRVLLPDYRYRAARDGVVENEICPVLVGRLPDGAAPEPHPAEVGAVRWIPWADFLAELAADPEPWSPWCLEEARLLEESASFREWLEPPA